MAVGSWVVSRLKEVSTHVGWVMCASTAYTTGLTSSNQSNQTMIDLWNHAAPMIGGLLVGATTTKSESDVAKPAS